MPPHFHFCLAAPTGRVLLLLLSLLTGRSALGQAPPSFSTGAGQALPGLPFWKWLNPTPQHYLLNDLHAFTDSAALLVGNHGTALRTTDQGRTWTPLSVGTDRDLVSVDFATPQVGWIGYSTPATNAAIHDGGVGPGEIRRTTNGGLTWTRQPIGESFSVQLRKVIAVSATTVVVFYDWGRMQNGFHSGFRPRLRRSVNGGQTWTPIALPLPSPSVLAHDLVFPTSTTGFVGGGGGNFNEPGWLQRTTNGGQTWQDVTPDSGRLIVKSLCFLDAQQGWVAGDRRLPGDGGPQLLHTTNGGLTWSALPLTLPPNYQPLDGIAVVRFAPDGLHGILHDRTFTFWHTTDGGQTWISPVTGFTTYAAFRPPIIRMRASGVTWLQPADVALRVAASFTDSLRLTYATRSFCDDRLTTVAFPDPTHGWACAGARFVDVNGQYTTWTQVGQTVLQTADRGQHWRRLRLDSLTAGQVQWSSGTSSGGTFLTSGAFPDRDTAYVAGVEAYPQRNAFVVRSTDAGLTWTRLPLPFSAQAPFKLSFLDGRQGMIVGDSGLFALTHDGGQTWQRTFVTRTRLRTAGWLDARHLYVAGDSSTTAHSADGGATWQVVQMDSIGYTSSPQAVIQVPHTVVFDNMTFITPTVGFRALGSNYVARTTNRGRVFSTPMYTTNPDLYIQGGRTSELQQVVFRTPLEGYAFGSDQFRTLDGGTSWTVWAQTTTPTVAGALVDRYNAYVVGTGGTIIRYSEKLIRTDTALARTSFCLGTTADSLAVPFTTEGSFSPAELDFRVELSNRMGRFRPHETTLVGRGPASPLLARLPANLPAGTYRLRVIRADSTVLGADNGVDLRITQRPAAVTLAPTDSVSICAGDSVQLTAPAGFGSYQWSTGATTATVWVRAAGSYAVQVGTAADCLSPASDSVRVRVKPVPPTPLITATPGQPAGGVLLSSSAASGNQWFFNGQPLSGATQPTYLAATPGQSGSYTVQATLAGCASPVSAAVPVTITGTAAALATAVRIYPNPAHGSVLVRAGENAVLTRLTLTDLTGRVLMSLTSDAPEVVLPLANVAAGTYLLHAQLRSGATTTRRLMVEK